MDDLDSDVRETCVKCREALHKLQTHLAPLFATPRAALKRLPPADAARLHIALSFAAVNLFHMYLRTQGQRPAADHPIHHEARRVHQYLEKLREATDDATRRTLVDTAAAGRLLVHVLGRDGTGRGAGAKKKKKAKAPTSPQGQHTSFPEEDEAQPATEPPPPAPHDPRERSPPGSPVGEAEEVSSEGEAVEVAAPAKRRRAAGEPGAPERRKKRKTPSGAKPS
eukprot:EG_transcript_20008